MKKLTLAAIIASTATIGVTGLAVAQGEPQQDRKSWMLERLDTNGDGAISQAEVDAMKAEREAQKAAKFAEADTNGDGALTMAELDAFQTAERERRMEERKQRMFERADADGSGTISLAEFETRRHHGRRGDGDMFTRLDTDEDGLITAEELEAMKGHHGKRGWRHHRKGGMEN
ncbi:EF-hand domain-containing protein [Henriciella sp. AS95]|uniref:EF-hand domain-containing protein n=1 Tax=Henriciella sp. AS95 TaxID=3135782 RepID=UPI003170B226